MVDHSVTMAIFTSVKGGRYFGELRQFQIKNRHLTYEKLDNFTIPEQALTEEFFGYFKQGKVFDFITTHAVIENDNPLAFVSKAMHFDSKAYFEEVYNFAKHSWKPAISHDDPAEAHKCRGDLFIFTLYHSNNRVTIHEQTGGSCAFNASDYLDEVLEYICERCDRQKRRKVKYYTSIYRV